MKLARLLFILLTFAGVALSQEVLRPTTPSLPGGTSVISGATGLTRATSITWSGFPAPSGTYGSLSLTVVVSSTYNTMGNLGSLALDWYNGSVWQTVLVKTNTPVHGTYSIAIDPTTATSAIQVKATIWASSYYTDSWSTSTTTVSVADVYTTGTLPSYILSGAISGASTGSGTVTGCPGSHYYGSAYSCTLAPDVGSYIASVTGCGGTLVGSTYSGVMPAADCTVTARFDVLRYVLTVTASGPGTGTTTGSGTYDYGTVITPTATPTGGSSFAAWSGGGCSVDPCHVTITGDTTVNASFNAPVSGTVRRRVTAVWY